MKNDNSLSNTFTRTKPPTWSCPSCQRGDLNIVEGSLIKGELAHSRDHSDQDWEPEWIEGVFSCHFNCDYNKCEEIVVCAGIWSVTSFYEEVDIDSGYTIEDFHDEWFKAEYLNPPLQVIAIPKSCPDKVEKNITQSYHLLFSSPQACANKIRSSLEYILDDLDIPRKGKKGRYKSLHDRIHELTSTHEEIKETFQATKWIGNRGSHGDDELTHNDILHAYRFLEDILDTIYNKEEREKIRQKAILINKHKGRIIENCDELL